LLRRAKKSLRRQLYFNVSKTNSIFNVFFIVLTVAPKKSGPAVAAIPDQFVKGKLKVPTYTCHLYPTTKERMQEVVGTKCILVGDWFDDSKAAPDDVGLKKVGLDPMLVDMELGTNNLK
jgi:hypothetical protein